MRQGSLLSPIYTLHTHNLQFKETGTESLSVFFLKVTWLVNKASNQIQIWEPESIVQSHNLTVTLAVAVFIRVVNSIQINLTQQVSQVPIHARSSL